MSQQDCGDEFEGDGDDDKRNDGYGNDDDDDCEHSCDEANNNEKYNSDSVNDHHTYK